MPGERYFGNTLTELQSALTARDRLAAEQNIASQGNMVRFTQGMQQSAAQRATLQQQAMQQAAANQLSQQQMAQDDYFNRGRLQNEEARIAAVLEQAKAQDAGVDRRFAQEDATRRFVAEQMAARGTGAENVTATHLTDVWNSAAETAANRFNTLWNSEQAAQQFVIGQEQKKRGAEWFTSQGTASKEAQDKLGSLKVVGFNNFLQKIQADPDADKVIWEGTVAKPKLRASTARATPFFGTGAPSRTQAVTNGAAYFNPTATNGAPNRDALIQKITQDFRAGVIDRATAEQGLRALGVQ